MLRQQINKLLLTGIVPAILLACNGPGNRQEAENLLIKQAELLKNKQGDIERMYDKINVLSDSTYWEKDRLKNENYTLEVDRKGLERAELEIEKAKLKVYQHLLVKDSLNLGLLKVQADLQNATAEQERILFVLDSLDETNTILDALGKNVTNRLLSGLSEINSELSMLEREVRKEDLIIEFSEKRIRIIKRKKEVITDEIQLTSQEKSYSLRFGESDKRLTAESTIRDLQAQVLQEDEKIERSIVEMEIAKIRRTDLITQQENLKKDIDQDYDTQNLLIELMTDQENEISFAISSIQAREEHLSARIKQLEMSVETLTRQIKLVEKEMLPLNWDTMHELSSLGRVEVNDRYEIEDLSSSDDLLLLKKTIEVPKANLAPTTKELENENTLLSAQTGARENSKNMTIKSVGFVLGILGIIVTALLTLLFLLGRHQKKISIQ